MNGSENIITTLLNELTGGLGSISNGNQLDFNAGPLGSISGVLDKFNLSFDNLLDELLKLYHELRSDLLNLETEVQLLVDLKPKSLSNYPDFMQLGSKIPATQFSSAFKAQLWSTLTTKFPTATYNGVSIPGLTNGMSLNDQFPNGNGFPSKFKCTSTCLPFIYLLLTQ